MHRLFLKCVLAFVAAALCCGHSLAQEQTIWQAKDGDWFQSRNWTLGVPNLELPAVIPDGTVTASSRQNAPSAASLSIGRREQQVSKAQLTVTDSVLNILNRLDVAHSSGEVTGILNTAGGKSDVVVGGEVNVGVARPGTFARNRSNLNAEVSIDGSLVARPGTAPALRIGSLSEDGSVDAKASATGEVAGFSNTFIGVIEQGGFGTANGRLEADNLMGIGESNLFIGTNFGTGFSSGHVDVRGEVGGFQLVQIGNAGSTGRGEGTLTVGGLLSAQNVEVGNKSGTGFGQLEFLPGAAFRGGNINVNANGQVALPQLLSGELVNRGRLSIPDAPRLPSVVRIDGSFRQLGIVTLDVRNLDPEFGYDRIEVSDDLRLGGRFDLRFAEDFDPSPGEFEFISGNTRVTVEPPPAIRLINPPKGLAIAPDFRDGFRVSLVEPEPLEFVNSGKKTLELGDPELWNGVVPQSFNQLKLINDNSFPQSVMAFDSSIQSLVVGGRGGVELFVPVGRTLNVTHDLTVNSGSTFALPNSQLVTSQLTLDDGAKFQQAGGTVAGSVLNAGRINVGAGESRQLVIEGDFEQEASGLIELDLVNGQEFDQIIVDGAANLDGRLLINLPENLKLEAGLELPLIRSADGSLDLDIYFQGIERFKDFNLQLRNSGGSVTLFAISADLSSLGDMNADGVKDETDILAFSMALTDISAYLDSEISEGVHPLFPGDLNFDGQLDLDDIEPFLACLETDICLPELVEVPEPSSVGLATYLGMLLVCTQRRRIERKSK